MLNMKYTFSIIVFSLIAVLGAPHAGAQTPDSLVKQQEQNIPNGRFYGFGNLGFAGDLDLELKAQGEKVSGEGELDVSPGLGLGFDYAVHPNLALGVRVGLEFWRGDKDEGDRATMLDLDFAF